MNGWPDVIIHLTRDWDKWLRVGLVLLGMGILYFALTGVRAFLSKITKGKWSVKGKDKSATYDGADRRTK